jgi:cytochrome c peroxidase
VPSLRNVAMTAPYFHDGSAATLEEAVRRMAAAQLDRTLTDQQVESLVAFLKTLTGNYRGKPVIGGAP